MISIPTGTVTFLFNDIEGTTSFGSVIRGLFMVNIGLVDEAFTQRPFLYQLNLDDSVVISRFVYSEEAMTNAK